MAVKKLKEGKEGKRWGGKKLRYAKLLKINGNRSYGLQNSLDIFWKGLHFGIMSKLELSYECRNILSDF